MLHKTTLDEAPALVSVAAIYALTIEGAQAVIYSGGSHPLPTWVILTAAADPVPRRRALLRRADDRSPSACS